jgi:hypothetical protein
MNRFACAVTAVLGAACLATNALGADTGYSRIAFVKILSNGTHVSLHGFTNTDSSISCERNDFFLLSTEGNYEAKTALLMAALMGEREVRITYYLCEGPYLKFGSVQGR